MVNDFQFKGGNPGAVQYGNFINYYKFHPPGERINLLPKNLWGLKEPYEILDVGCNVGDLTVALKKFLDQNLDVNSSVLAVDIDPILIKRASEMFNNDLITFKCLDIMNDIQRINEIDNYLKSKSLRNFSVCFCFSTTMWIHLNHGDDGLKNFLKYLTSICEILVIEPQPWKCYRNAVKRMKQQNFSFPNFNQLKIQQNVEDAIEVYILKECGLTKVFETDRTKWDRKIFVFKHQFVTI